jgi:hypothetical protein
MGLKLRSLGTCTLKHSREQPRSSRIPSAHGLRAAIGSVLLLATEGRA